MRGDTLDGVWAALLLAVDRAADSRGMLILDTAGVWAKSITRSMSSSGFRSDFGCILLTVVV